MNIVYNPLDNSPRGSESKAIPGPGEYAYKNMAIGQDSRHFSFLRRTRNSQGKCSISFLTEKSQTLSCRESARVATAIRFGLEVFDYVNIYLNRSKLHLRMHN